MVLANLRVQLMPKREVTSAPWVPVPAAARAYTGKAPRARQHRAVGRLSAGAPRLHKIFTLPATD